MQANNQVQTFLLLVIAAALILMVYLLFLIYQVLAPLH